MPKFTPRPPGTAPPYLFESQINARRKASAGENRKLDGFGADCVRVTSELLLAHARRPLTAYTAQDPTAAKLAESMGTKTSSGPHHASKYVHAWRNLSENYHEVVAFVNGELAHAYALGLDIRNPDVIGAMYILAAELFSLGPYRGSTGDRKDEKR
jgi:hypothetical protein